VWTPLAADLEEIAEARSGDQARARTAALDQRVGGHGRAVPKVADRGVGIARPLAQAVGDAAHDRPRGIVGRARGLPDVDFAGRGIDEADVRERTAGVHTDAPDGHSMEKP